MATVRVPDSIKEELEAMNLVVWLAHHPLRWDYEVNGIKGKGKHNTEIVIVQLAGPGLDERSLWGHGPNIRVAVDEALKANHYTLARVPGLKGAMLRLESEMARTARQVALTCWRAGGHPDDEVPF